MTFAAGRKIPKTKNVKTMPTAATSPKSRMGASSLAKLAAKPITVVPVTMKKATSN